MAKFSGRCCGYLDLLQEQFEAPNEPFRRAPWPQQSCITVLVFQGDFVGRWMEGKSFQIWDRQPAHESIQQPIHSCCFCYMSFFLFQKALRLILMPCSLDPCLCLTEPNRTGKDACDARFPGRLEVWMELSHIWPLGYAALLAIRTLRDQPPMTLDCSGKKAQ